MRDTSISFPELWLNVYVSGPPMDTQGFPEMFMRGRCYKADTPDEADLVVFTGGPDVDPAYYAPGIKVHDSVYIDEARDRADLDLYAKCYDEGIPMMGVCRGAQFGHVMNGGTLYQDIDNHQSAHSMFTDDNETIHVSSVHHQSCVFNDDMDVLGWGNQSSVRSLNANHTEKGTIRDIEAFFYKDTCFFGVQGHPEYKGFLGFTHWCLSKIEHLISFNPDVELIKEQGVYRLKESIRRERDERPSERIKEIA